MYLWSQMGMRRVVLSCRCEQVWVSSSSLRWTTTVFIFLFHDEWCAAWNRCQCNQWAKLSISVLTLSAVVIFPMAHRVTPGLCFSFMSSSALPWAFGLLRDLLRCIEMPFVSVIVCTLVNFFTPSKFAGVHSCRRHFGARGFCCCCLFVYLKMNWVSDALVASLTLVLNKQQQQLAVSHCSVLSVSSNQSLALSLLVSHCGSVLSALLVVINP